MERDLKVVVLRQSESRLCDDFRFGEVCVRGRIIGVV